MFFSNKWRLQTDKNQSDRVTIHECYRYLISKLHQELDGKLVTSSGNSLNHILQMPITNVGLQFYECFATQPKQRL